MLSIKIQAMEYGNLCRLYLQMPVFLLLECVETHEVTVFIPYLAGKKKSVTLTPVKEITGAGNY